MTDYLLRLGWPARCLHPNDRADRRAATASRAAARWEGWAETTRAGAVIAADAHLEVTFYPPDNRKRDLDGLLASIKPHLDGISQAAKVDDAGWTFTLRKGPKVKDGAVVVHVREAPTWASIGDITKKLVGEMEDERKDQPA